MPDLTRRSGSILILNGEHPRLDAQWGNGNDRRIYVTVCPVTDTLIRRVHEHSTGDFSKIFYEGPVRNNAKEQGPLQIEVDHVNSIIADSGAAMKFWSIGVPEQVK